MKVERMHGVKLYVPKFYAPLKRPRWSWIPWWIRALLWAIWGGVLFGLFCAGMLLPVALIFGRS